MTSGCPFWLFPSVFHELSLSHCLSANNSYCSGSGTGQEQPGWLLLEERCLISDSERRNEGWAEKGARDGQEGKWPSHSQKGFLDQKSN